MTKKISLLFTLFLVSACANQSFDNQELSTVPRVPFENTAAFNNQQAKIPASINQKKSTAQQKKPAMPVKEFIVGDRVYFDFNSSKLGPEAAKTLQRQANWLKQNPDKNIILEGHDDMRGTREYSYKIALKRAIKVKKFLVKKGIDKNRIKIASYGRDFPEYKEISEAAWSKNRRVVAVIADY